MFDWVGALGDGTDFELVSSFPRRTFAAAAADETLASLGAQPRLYPT